MRSWLTVLGILFIQASVLALDLDEAPAEPGEWGFRPDDAMVDVNPPAFCWRPAQSAASYTLQVARDKAFTDVVYDAPGLPWSSHCPPRPFDAGSYFWRYRAVVNEGDMSPWSQVRRFSVGSDTVVFPQPSKETLAERIPTQHPRLFFRPEDVARLRELAAGPLAGRRDEIVKTAEKLLASPPDTSEPPKYPKEVTRDKAPGEWKQIWWGNRTRVIAVADGAATLGFAYQLTGDEKYAQAARDLIVAMTTWDADGATSYKYNDEAAMPAMYMTSRGYSWAWPAFSESDREAVRAMMRARGNQAFKHLHGRNHLWQPYASHSNRSWHFLGEIAIAFYDEIPEAPMWLDFAMTVFYTAYPAWGGPDGGWHEGMSYWSSYTSRFMYWVFAVRSAFDIDVFERPFYRRVGYFPMYGMPPGTKTGGFGDLAFSTGASNVAPLVAVLANGAHNPHWKWYADQSGGDVGKGYLGFLYASAGMALEPAPPADSPTSACFRDVGIAFLNTNLLDGADNVQVHFKSSPYGRQSHGYNSNNAFLLHLNGERAFIRSGKRDLHGSPHHYKYMHESKSDNAILVNGKGQIPHSAAARGRITVFDTSPGVDVVAGEAGEAYDNLDRWTRRIIFLKPGAIVIHDVLEAPEPSAFDWMLHAIDNPFEIDGQTLRWTGKPGSVEVRFLEPQGLECSQTDQYDIPPAEWANVNWKEWHLSAHSAEKVNRRQFVTLLVINNAEVSPQSTPGDAPEIRLSTPAGEARVKLEWDRFSVDAPGFERTYE